MGYPNFSNECFYDDAFPFHLPENNQTYIFDTKCDALGIVAS